MAKALMFTRVARNLAKNGYFPTDEATTARVLEALEPPPEGGRMLLFDPTCGEGAALAEIASGLGREACTTYGIEYDAERAGAAHRVLDRVIHADLQDCTLPQRRCGLLWCNPPYGALAADQARTGQAEFKGRKTLEKLLYRLAFPALAPDGVLVLIVPGYALDAEMVGWLVAWFDDLTVHRAAVDTYKQVVILGRRRRQRCNAIAQGAAGKVREHLLAVGKGEREVPVLPEWWAGEPYVVPALPEGPLPAIELSVLEPVQLGREVAHLPCLWQSTFPAQFGHRGLSERRPARAMTRWHLALALAAGQVSGLVQSDDGSRVLLIKGSTLKTRDRKVDVETYEDGSTSETVVLTDRFVPTIMAIDMTDGSPAYGEILTIR